MATDAPTPTSKIAGLMTLDQLSGWLYSRHEAFGMKPQRSSPNEALLSKETVGHWDNVFPIETSTDYDSSLSDSSFIVSTVDFCDWALQQKFLPGEFALTSYVSRSVDRYIGQVHNGGHDSYLYNHQWRQPSVRCIEFGLEQMECFEYLAVFKELRDFIEGDYQRAARIADAYNNHDPQYNTLLNGFDRRLYAADRHREEYTRKHAAWLRRNANYLSLDAKTLQAKRSVFAKSNSMLSERQAIYGRKSEVINRSKSIRSAVLDILHRLDASLNLSKPVFMNGWGSELDRSTFGEAPHFAREWVISLGEHVVGLVVAAHSKQGTPLALLFPAGASSFFPAAEIAITEAEFVLAAAMPSDKRRWSR